jgi:hypothetical protein
MIEPTPVEKGDRRREPVQVFIVKNCQRLWQT